VGLSIFAISSKRDFSFLGTLEELPRAEKLSRTDTTRRNVYNDLTRDILPTLADDRAVIVSNKASQQYKAILADNGQPEPTLHAHQVNLPPAELGVYQFLIIKVHILPFLD
jgi:hypothetical protein